jgi:hypothetical protein
MRITGGKLRERASKRFYKFVSYYPTNRYDTLRSSTLNSFRKLKSSEIHLRCRWELHKFRAYTPGKRGTKVTTFQLTCDTKPKHQLGQTHVGIQHSKGNRYHTTTLGLSLFQYILSYQETKRDHRDLKMRDRCRKSKNNTYVHRNHSPPPSLSGIFPSSVRALLISTVRLWCTLHDESYSISNADCAEYTGLLNLQTRGKMSRFLRFPERFRIIYFCSSVCAWLQGVHTHSWVNTASYSRGIGENITIEAWSWLITPI